MFHLWKSVFVEVAVKKGQCRDPKVDIYINVLACFSHLIYNSSKNSTRYNMYAIVLVTRMITISTNKPFKSIDKWD